MTIPRKIMRPLFIASDAMCVVVVLCVAMRRPLASRFGYDSLIWLSCSISARLLLVTIPVVVAAYFIGSDRARVLTFQRANRLQDASSMFLMGFLRCSGLSAIMAPAPSAGPSLPYRRIRPSCRCRFSPCGLILRQMILTQPALVLSPVQQVKVCLRTRRLSERRSTG